jgi:LysR family transcriptional regulator, pca operon transcriptional activator
MIMHPAIKLRHIRAFLDIAAAGNLTAVARAQGLTQPALSRSLAELEALLDTPLFSREARRLVLTDAGRIFRQHASLGLQALEAGVASLHPNASQRIRVGVLPTAATRLFAQVALRWQAVSPAAVLSVVTGPQAHLLQLLRAGEIELMVGRMPAAPEMAGLSFTHLYDEDIILAARPDHALRQASVAQILATCPLVLPPQGAIIRRSVDEYLVSLGLAGLQPSFETVALPIGRGIVMGSQAVWFISRGVIRDELARGDLIEIALHAPFLSGAVGITTRPEQSAKGLDGLIEITRDCVDRGLHR